MPHRVMFSKVIMTHFILLAEDMLSFFGLQDKAPCKIDRWSSRVVRRRERAWA